MKRIFLTLCTGCLLVGLAIQHAAIAETWTDSTGKFRLEAEFIGVKGKSIVLRKPDGSTINVPIDRLSPQSRALAKRLYDEMSAKPPSDAAVPPTSNPNPSRSANVPSGFAAGQSPELNFDPPNPPAVQPMQAYPQSADLQQTVDFVREQLLAGHPEVFWHALPDIVRQTYDGDEVRQNLVAAQRAQREVNDKVGPSVYKVLELLIRQKPFILNTAMLQQLPPPIKETVEQGYDPAVGLLYEMVQMSLGLEALSDTTMTRYLDHFGPRVGGHGVQLIDFAPPGMVDGLLNSIAVEQPDDSTGTVTFTKPDGTKQVTTMVRFGGRWVPEQLASQWDEIKTRIIEKSKANTDPVNLNLDKVGQMVASFDQMIDPLLAAKTQQEFDGALMPLVMAIAAMQRATQNQAPGVPGF